MIKKLPLLPLFLLFAFASYGQTIVSTSVENKNVILEEFTGIYCVYCPDGHTIAQAIQNANPTRVSLINVHTGLYANPLGSDPDFRTPFGSAIAAQSKLNGYPAGQVNRHFFAGRGQTPTATAMGRNHWTAAANEILATPSYVNLAATATIDAETNVMNILVEAYYTGNSPESTNFLNVALVQNNTKGPQTGGNKGNNYNHMHRLINMITGQWGEEITQTTSGTFITRNYTYPILPHNNYIPVEIGELEVVVFMSETHQEIISGNKAIPTVSVTNTNDVNVRYIEEIPTACVGTNVSLSPKVNIQNAGLNPITSLDINYNINGTSTLYSWSGTLASLQSKTITLPATNIPVQGSNSVIISVPNDDNNTTNEQTVLFDSAPAGTGTVDMVLVTDYYGKDCRWRLKDSSGNILFSGGPYTNATIHTITRRFNLAADCYTFTLMDTNGNGGTKVTLTDTDGKQLYYNDGNFGSIDDTEFSSNGILTTNQFQLENVHIFPNPAQSILNVTNAESADVQVYDMLGRAILTKENITMNEQLNVSGLHAGTYFIKITKEGLTATKKFIVAK